MNINELIALVRWHQKWEIEPGVFTPGVNPVAFIMEAAGVPLDLTGQRVLDIGAWNGCFSFEAERRGASVLAIGPEAAENTGFSDIKSYLGSKVEYQQGTIYQLDPERLGKFDIVLCFGVIYHLRHVLLAFDCMRRVCLKSLHLETASIDDHFLSFDPASEESKFNILHEPEQRAVTSHVLAELAPAVASLPIMQFYRLNELACDPTNWFAMNQQCLRDIALSSGFRPTKVTQFPNRLAATCEVIPGYPEWIGNSGEGVYYDIITKPILGPRDVY